ncbi:olfactory receptor 52B2-like [Clarias gariepinus]|uniref:olfactory receptor 52B2-like n=1 Tax=Clarias gariepinus TaxID=13013 RepID=UPI00234D1C90|nr:olfactory receptor 52B2-like [Clarias gariepinus]
MSYNNSARFMVILTLESLDLPLSGGIAILLFGMIAYCFILLFQSMLLVTIVVKRDLHKPMYILLFNLFICDLTGTTGFYPQLICSILFQSREISYPACALQGFLIHIYGNGSSLFLSVMAFDRYLAICKPLRYHTLMRGDTLMKLIFIVWTVNFATIGYLFMLTMSKEICRTNIVDTFCNLPSLMKLSCKDMSVANYSGLFNMALVNASSIFITSFTYIKILITCFSSKQEKSISKAIQTCGTHLVVYFTFEVNVLFALISHRFESASPHLRRAFAVSIVIFPPIFNPLIYGLNTQQIRQTIFTFTQRFTLSNRKAKN